MRQRLNWLLLSIFIVMGTEAAILLAQSTLAGFGIKEN